MRQWIVTMFNGSELLVTLDNDEELEVSPRVDHTRWGRPFQIVELPEWDIEE